MEKSKLYSLISTVCTSILALFLVFSIVSISVFHRVERVHPIISYSIMIILAVGVYFDFKYRKLTNKKSFLYAETKKRHFLNYAIFILAMLLTTVLSSYVYIKFF